MFLIIGLGNPGEKYKHTRHNVGYDVVEKIFNNPKFQLHKHVQAELANIEISGKKVVLAKPVTFMNESGKAVEKLVKNYLPAQAGQSRITNELIIIHDDISLELGTIKISRGAGAGNHHGVKSVIDHLGTQDFIRVRCGIGRGSGILSDVVLSSFMQDELDIVRPMVQRAAEAASMIVSEGVEHAMNVYNT